MRNDRHSTHTLSRHGGKDSARLVAIARRQLFRKAPVFALQHRASCTSLVCARRIGNMSAFSSATSCLYKHWHLRKKSRNAVTGHVSLGKIFDSHLSCHLLSLSPVLSQRTLSLSKSFLLFKQRNCKRLSSTSTQKCTQAYLQ